MLQNEMLKAILLNINLTLKKGNTPKTVRPTNKNRAKPMNIWNSTPYTWSHSCTYRTIIRGVRICKKPFADLYQKDACVLKWRRRQPFMHGTYRRHATNHLCITFVSPIIFYNFCVGVWNMKSRMRKYNKVQNEI